MPEFQYIARELSGTEVTGVITAASEHEAVSSLSQRALFPVQVNATEDAAKGKRGWGNKVRNRHLAMLFSQLADLLHSGVPLLRSLEILQQQSSQAALSAVLGDIRERVADGTPLADAVTAHPDVFNDLTASMIRAGEEGGFLEDVLKRIAQFTEHQEDLKSRVVGAIAYPAFLAVMGSIIVTGIIVYFVPKFEPLFERLKDRGGLPWPTTALMALSDFLGGYGLWLVGAIAIVIWWLNRYFNTEAGRRRMDYWKLHVVGAGPIIRSLAVSRFCRILGTLLHNGVPILRSLQISKDATGNVILSEAVGLAAENISAGKSLAQPLKKSGQFSTEVVEMIAVGEEANSLETVLVDIADNMERRTNRQLELFVRLLEPVMLLAMAVVILFVVIALLLPVFKGAGALQ
jgi:type II secretory pathway component PulF